MKFLGMCAIAVQGCATDRGCKCCQSGNTVGVKECVGTALMCLVCSSDAQTIASVFAGVSERVQSVHAVHGNKCLCANATRVRSARTYSNSCAYAIVHATKFTSQSLNSNYVLHTAGRSSNALLLRFFSSCDRSATA